MISYLSQRIAKWFDTITTYIVAYNQKIAHKMCITNPDNIQYN